MINVHLLTDGLQSSHKSHKGVCIEMLKQKPFRSNIKSSVLKDTIRQNSIDDSKNLIYTNYRTLVRIVCVYRGGAENERSKKKV